MSYEDSPWRRITPRLLFGLALVLAGVLFTLDNLGLVRAGDYLRLWPLFLVAMGGLRFLSARHPGDYVGAVLWGTAGLWLLAYNLGWFPYGIDDLWPLLLVALGILLIARAMRPHRPLRGDWASGSIRAARRASRAADRAAQRAADSVSRAAGRYQTEWGSESATPPPEPPSDESATTAAQGEDRVEAFAVMSGMKRSLGTADFRGGSLTAIMGGCEVDLRGSRLTTERAVLDVFAFWGAIEIRVPPTWQVVNRVWPLMAGCEDNSTPPPAGEAQGELLVTGWAVMGGVEIKN